MNGLSPLQEAILAEGLEDLIPLPEIAATIRLRLAPSYSTIRELSAALLALLDDGRIQVWSSHWSEEPKIVSRREARLLLLLEEQYEFNSPTDLIQRVYYVNVDNLEVAEGE